MAGKRQFSIAEVKEAIKGSAGNVSLVASRLSCERSTVYRYLKKYAELSAAFDAEDGTVQGRPQYPVENFERAIEGSHGIIAVVAQRVGCSRGTVENALERWPHLRDLLKESREDLVDAGESAVVTTLHSDDEKLKFEAAKYITKTLGKERGWSERKELTGANGEALFTVPDDVMAAAVIVGIDLPQAWEKFLTMIRVQARQLEALNDGKAT